MSKLLYQTDSYLDYFQAKIFAFGEQNSVILDQTAFYPGGGGQPHDVGSIIKENQQINVIKVSKNGEDVLHSLEKSPESYGLQIGDSVEGKIDFDLRSKYCRTHTAMHILCGVIYNEFGSTVTGGDFGALNGRMDFDIDNFTKERINFIEDKCNQAIEANYPVKVEFLSRDVADSSPELIRTKINLVPKTVNVVRVIDIVGLDKQADGGTHVKSTGEVGKIKIVKIENKGKGRKRIYNEILDKIV